MSKPKCSFCGNDVELLRKAGTPVVGGKVINGKQSFICRDCAKSLKENNGGDK